LFISSCWGGLYHGFLKVKSVYRDEDDPLFALVDELTAPEKLEKGSVAKETVIVGGGPQQRHAAKMLVVWENMKESIRGPNGTPVEDVYDVAEMLTKWALIPPLWKCETSPQVESFGAGMQHMGPGRTTVEFETLGYGRFQMSGDELVRFMNTGECRVISWSMESGGYDLAWRQEADDFGRELAAAMRR